MTLRPLTLGSLFAGIGGFDLGFEKSGIVTRWQCEIDGKCRLVLARQFPAAARYVDVCALRGGEVEPVDIITFGSPCQDLSVAGKRAGFNDGTRSNLFFEAIRIIEEMREATDGRYPGFAVWENVPGAFSSHGGDDFRAALSALCGGRAIPRPRAGWASAGLVRGHGRSVAWRLLNAQHFGVAQRRRRVFALVDFRGDRAAEILFEPGGMSGDPASGNEAGEGVAGGAGDGAGGGGDVALCLNGKAGKRYDGESETFVTHALSAEGHDASEDGTGRGTPIIAFGANDSGQDAGEDIAPTVRCGGKAGGGVHTAVAFTERTRAEGRTFEASEDVSYALTNPGSGGRTHSLALMDTSMAVRRLTPVECCRLQGFPDDWNAWGLDDAGQRVEMSDATRYRQLGNAVCVNVAEWLGRRAKTVLQTL